jgi:predicted nucleic acid-binding protein
VKILLDTCVLAELRHPKGNINVKKYIADCEDQNLYISVLCLAEINKGIQLLAEVENERKIILTKWLNGLEKQFSKNILQIDYEGALIWSEISARLQLKGVNLPAIDGLLAATALQYGMHFMTRNTRHFEAAGVLLLNPW